MIRVEEPRMNAKLIPFLVTLTSADQVAPKTQIRQCRVSSSYGCSRTQSHRLSIGRRMYVFPGGDKTCAMGSPQTLALRTIAFDTKSGRWPLRSLSFLYEIS